MTSGGAVVHKDRHGPGPGRDQTHGGPASLRNAFRYPTCPQSAESPISAHLDEFHGLTRHAHGTS